MRPTDPKQDPAPSSAETDDEPPPTRVDFDPGFPGSFDEAVIDPDTTVGGVESRILLARARRQLLGWDETPVQVGRYRILERIGTGGMGVIYAAEDHELDRQVAIKILRHDLAPGTTGRQRLLREAQATAKLSHPNVVHVYEVGQEGDQVFMAMELVRGDTLRAWRDAGTHGWQEIVEMYLHAGEGLAAAHAEGIVHRDFKPDNVLVGRDGRPRVLDFGLARATAEVLSSADSLPSMSTTGGTPAASRSGASLQDLDLTRTGTVVGTPAYMAPEQLERAEPDARTDQFSFCVALFEALHGRRPFAGSTYTELADNIARGAMISVDPRARGIPRALHAVILTGLAREPAARHRDMRALLDALRGACKPDPRPARIRTLAGALGLGAATLAAITLTRDDDTPTTQAPTPEPQPETPAPAGDPWAAIVADSELPPVIDTPLSDDPTGTTVHRLRNGLTIYVVPRPLEPFVNATLVVRAGAREEGDSSQGIAPLTLAAVMEGGARLGVRDAAAERPLLALEASLLEGLGAVTQPRARDALLRTAGGAEAAAGFTALHSEYYGAALGLGGHEPLSLSGPGSIVSIEIPTHRFGAWVELSAEMLRRPTFRNFMTVTSQKLEFLEWISEGQRAEQAGTRAIAPATGVREDFEAASQKLAGVPLAETRAFWDAYYRPNNTAIVLIGDITPSQAIATVERYFGDWEPAAIPKPTAIEHPLAQVRTQIDVTDTGPPMVFLTWPLPPPAAPEYAAFVELNRVLGGADGILAGALRDTTSGGSSDIGPHRDFYVAVFPAPEQSLIDAEQQMIGVLEDVAADRISAPMWERALAQAELERHRWARSNGALTRLLVESYLGRAPWHDVARSLGPTPIDRARVIATANTLLTTGHIAVHRTSGKVPHTLRPQLPIERLAPKLGVHSGFVQGLIDAPATPMEPRFLVEGSHYRVAQRGAGRVITAESQDPIARLSWIHPIGAAEDPFVCDALRAHAERIPVAGFEAQVHCTAADARIDIIATVAAFDRELPQLVAWLSSGELSIEDAELHAEQAVQWRREMRADPWLRAAALHTWALRGPAMLDVQLPSDRVLQREGPRAMIASLRSLTQYDPDILYIGPNAERLLGALPPPTGATAGVPMVRSWRELTTPTVFLLDDPDRADISVRAAIPWFATDARDQLAASMHLAATQMAALDTAAGLDPEHPNYNAKWSPNAPVGIGVGLRAAPSDLAPAMASVLEMLRARPSAAEFPSARDRLEITFRAWRVPARDVPDRVREWPTGTTDPRVAQWLALPNLGHDDMARYFAAVDARLPIVSIAADASKLDLAVLREHGEIVRVSIDDILRDPMLDEIGDDTPSMLAD